MKYMNGNIECKKVSFPLYEEGRKSICSIRCPTLKQLKIN